LLHALYGHKLITEYDLARRICYGQCRFQSSRGSLLGGTDTGMNPVEALLASLAACKSIVVRAFVRKYRIKLKSIRVEVEGDLDPDGFLGKNPEAKIGFSEIRSHFFIEADNTDEEIERYIDFVERNCPVQDTLTKAARISHTIN